MLQDLLSLIPDSPEYQLVKDAIIRVAQTFPEQMPEITPEKVTGWVNEIAGGAGRDATTIRNDIFQYIVEPGVIQSQLGVDATTASNLINQTGGAQFATYAPLANAGNVNANPGAPMTILFGRNMQWYFDSGTNKWYVAYGLASGQQLVFEAEQDQMDSLFGKGIRPSGYQVIPFKDLIAQSNTTFSGNVAEMEGEGIFEDEWAKAQALALDEGTLPSWMNNDPAAIDFLLIAQAEGKSDEWVMEQWSKLPSFQARFPNLSTFQTSQNLSLSEAVTGFLEFEAQLRTIALQDGKDPASMTPEVVGGLLAKGYTTQFVADTFQAFRRADQYGPALEALNQVLIAQGKAPLSGEDQIKFLMGQAPQDTYDTYEAASYQEAAQRAGLGALFQADDAIRSALQSPGMVTLEQATQGMQQAAQLLLRLRGELDLGAYGLDHEELIDLSLNLQPRSGRTETEIQDSIFRAMQSAKGWIESSGGKPFTGYSSQGVPLSASLGRARTA